MFAEEVEIIIANAVYEQKLSLEQTQQKIFENLQIGELRNSADVKLVETYYIKVLLECARVEAEQCFDQCCRNREFIKIFVQNPDQCSTIQDIKRICESADYIVKLESYSNLIDEYDLTSFITNLKAYLWRKILEVADDSFQELEILQCLTLCFQTNTMQSDVQNQLVEFQRRLPEQSYSARFLKILMRNVPLEQTSRGRQLQKFLRSVERLNSDHLFLETQFLSLINFYLKPVEINIRKLHNRSIIEIIGGVIYMSKEVPKLEQIIQRDRCNERLDEVRFISLYMFEIDCDLKNSLWNGLNVFVMATTINVSKKCEWNLSGKNSGKHFTEASSGCSAGEDGKDGQDGYSGESSGNIMILAEQIDDLRNLKVILNGGNGSDGQHSKKNWCTTEPPKKSEDAGNGAKGKDGIGITLSKLKEEYPSPVRFWSFNQDVSTLFDKVLSKGKAEINWKKHPNRYIEVKLSNGQKIIYSLSRYGDFQCYLLYKGSKGEAGGRGGLNGLGGDGGFQGDCVVTKKDNNPFPVQIESKKDVKGQNGKTGKTGQCGKNGWDVGYTDYEYWTRIDEFGGKHNQRLTMDYSTSSSGRVYCGYRYDELGFSTCYATIKTSTLDDRILTESEKSRETRKEGQRRNEANATRKTMMSQRAMEKEYNKYFEKGENLMNTVSEMHSETMMNFNMMQRKAKQAFDEVESLKERSREKVSRYKIYEVTKKAKAISKQPVKMNSTSRREKKLDIIANIIHSPNNTNAWENLFQEEFINEELQKLKQCFDNYSKQRKLQTTEIKQIKQKFGLAKFRDLTNDNFLAEINQNIDFDDKFNSGIYLKISDKSYEDLAWLHNFQDETYQNENIKDAFNELRQYLLSTSDLNMIKIQYDKLVSIQINSKNLEELLQLWQTNENNSFSKLSELKKSKTEWNKLQETFENFHENTLNSTSLKHKIPGYKVEILNKDQDLVKYLFALFNNLQTLIVANDTLAKMIEWLIVENVNCKTCDATIQQYVQLEKTFVNQKETFLNNILLAIKFLSHRSPKPSWQNYHEYPTFSDLKNSSTYDSELLQDIYANLLKGLYDSYTKKQQEVIDWHAKLNEKILDICLQQMLSNKTISFAPLRELIAWKNGLQVRVYEKSNFNQFICSCQHFIHGKQVVNLLINENETVNNLITDQDYVELEISRQKLIAKFQSIRSNTEYLLPDEKEKINVELIINKLCQYFKEDDRDGLETRLEKLSSDSMEPNSILSSLLHCFTCDGCHLERNEIFVIVNTILECWTEFNINPEIFSYIILSHSQYHYIDELILINLENSIRKRLDNKEKLRDLLRKILDTTVKILIIKKLNSSQSIITEEAFSNMLKLLPYIKNDTTLLDQLDLSEWSLTLKETYWQHVLSNGGLGFKNENLEQCAFYLVKLENLYGNELVQYVIDIIKEAKIFPDKTLLIFVHRFYAEDMELCGDILDDFGVLNSALSRFFSESNVRYSGQELLRLCHENTGLSKKDFNQIQYLMTKLGLSESEDRDLDQLIQMITNSHKDHNVFKYLSIIRDLLTLTTNNENLVLKYILNEIKQDNQHENISIDNYYKDENKIRIIVSFIRSNIHQIRSIENYNFYLLDIINRGIWLKRRFSLRDTQKLVVMLMLMNERSLLSQVATGEGKTLIITTFCIIKCLYGEKFDIVTSCSVLAKRDAESEPPKGNKDLYELFGISVGHICSEDIDQRAQTFNRCDVVYGDLSSFQRDYLLDRFYGKNILGRRNFENVIVDEVDSMLLDNGNNMLYLSHDIANMEKLQSLFIFIWRSVNQPVLSLEDLDKVYNNETIKETIISDLYGMIRHDQVNDDTWQILIKSKLIGQDGRLLMNVTDYTAHIRQLGLQNPKTENRLIFLLNTMANRQRFIKIPSELYAFIEHHLDKFIDNAKTALLTSEGIDYVIDVDRTGLDPDLNPKIIIIDKNTGTDQSSSQWHEGLHQFLQIKHGCKLSLMSLKAVFISNVSYLKLYQNLYGLSGTLGSRDEKKLLNELYEIDLIKIPTSKPKNFFEERPIIAGFKDQWTKSIYDETRKKMISNRSVLIICETVKDVDYISKNLIKLASEDTRDDPNNVICNENLKKPYIYKREHEEFTFGQGNELFTCGKVIVATNLAGRGTDIKLEQKLIEAGGLHVIVTFLPNNCRIEEQAYGRAARCGEHGSGQLIVIGNDEEGGSYSSKIFQLKNIRDVYELQRLKTIKEHYDKRITVEENYFKKFQKQYEKLRQLWMSNEDLKGIEKLLLDSFLDKWAFWLDQHSQLIENHETKVSNGDVLDKNMKHFLTSITVDFSQWLNSPSQLLKLGCHYAKNKQYNKAEIYYDRIIEGYSYYSPEARYYKSFTTIKRKTSSLLNKSSSAFRQLKQDLLQAKQLFEERINDCSNDQAIVESFRRKEGNSLIYIEAFSEQQKNIVQIYNLFINSIEDILGHSVMNNSFLNVEINEILSYDIFTKLKQKDILTKPRTSASYSSQTLIDLTIEYGISNSSLEKLRMELSNNNVTNGKSLIGVIDLPNIEEFWSMLIDREILTNQIEFITINKQKLALIDMHQLTSLIDKYKMNLSLEKVQPNIILHYPIGPCEEYIICKMELYNQLDKSHRTYLEDRRILSINRTAKINPNEIKNQQDFGKFDSITISDLEKYKISTEDSIAILEILSQNDDGVLKETKEGRYRLTANINCSALPECYQDVVAAILNSKFSYQLAYQNLQEQYNDIEKNQKADNNVKLQLRLTSKPYEQFYYDLIDRGIIEDVQVNYPQLEQNDLKDILGNDLNTYAKNYEKLLKKENIEFIKKTLEQLRCGIEKYDIPDCYFFSLEQALKTQQNSCTVEASWFSLNGLENLITLEEQRYSWKFWRNFAVVVALGISQIVAGAVLEIVTAGVGTYGASFLINEGVSDLFFAAGSLFSGYMTMAGYWEHKKWSMAISAVTCMIGGVLARGRTVSRIGYKVAGPVRAEGGKKIAQMVGKELIQNVGGKTIAKETLKRVGCKVLEGVAYGAAQGAVDHIVMNYMNGVCDAIQKTITGDLDTIFQEKQLDEVVFEAYTTLDEEKANLVMNQVTRDCFQSDSILQTMYSWCKRIYGAVSRGIGEALRKIGKTDSAKSVQTVLLILRSLQIVSLIEGVMTEIVKVKISAGQFLDKAKKIIQEAIDEKTSTNTTRASAPANVNILCERSTQQWKQALIQTTNQAIASHIVAPLLSYGANQLISLAGNTIKQKHRSMKEEKYQKQFDSLKKDFDDKTKAEQIDSVEHEKILKTYHDNLMKLLAKTRSPKMFANILRENVPMDMVCAQACTFVLHKYISEMNLTDDDKKFTGLRITVQGQDGSSHEYSSTSNPSHSVTIQLDNNHFVIGKQENNDVNTLKNNCLYEALVSKYPGLKEAFANGAAFRQHLSNYIENDKYMSYTISQGWHKFSITKGSYGGAVKEESFNKNSIYNEMLKNMEKAKAKLIEKHGYFPDRVRQDLQYYIEAIRKIAQEENRSENTMERIYEITENFNKNLNYAAPDAKNQELRRDLKVFMKDFGIRVGLCLTAEYEKNLQNFYEKAQLADLHGVSFVATHPADRVDFTKDDIKLEKLIGKGMKLSENPDIIAGVIHGELNTTLSEDERRYNTIAVGIHKKTVYVAMNQIEQQGNNQSYGITDKKCEQIRDILMTKNLLGGREEIVFLTTNVAPRNQAECRAPHAEMQILKYWKDNKILEDNQNMTLNKPSRIGASKPACLCCSTVMLSNKIHHTMYAKANTNPVNWKHTQMINVRVQQKLRIRNFNA